MKELTHITFVVIPKVVLALLFWYSMIDLLVGIVKYLFFPEHSCVAG